MDLAEANFGKRCARYIHPEVQHLLRRVSDFLEGRGVTAWVVGGFIRDILLGRPTADIDISVSGDVLKIAPSLADFLGGRYVLLDSENGVGRVIPAKETGGATVYLDIASCQGSIATDLARRDFTINAMAVELRSLAREPATAVLIDPCGGEEDARQRIIRAVSPTVFQADPVRLLRAVRLAAEIGLSITEGTEALIRRDAPLVATVAGERVHEELQRFLAAPGSGRLLPYLDTLGLLTAIFPELEKARGVAQPKEHHWDVLEHSLRTAIAVDFLLRQGCWEYADKRLLEYVPWPPLLEQHFRQEVSAGSTRGALLKLAALLHDISKPETKGLVGDRLRFLGHAEEGAKVVAGRLQLLRFSARELRLVESMVKYHLRPGQLSQTGLPTPRAIYRYFRDTGDASIDTLFLSLADHLAARGPDLDLTNWHEHARLVSYVLARHLEQESRTRPPKLVDGHDIINIFGLEPGQEIGKLLEELHEAQASGEITTRQEALDFIRGRLSGKAE